MMGEITTETRLVDLTVGDLMTVIRQQYRSMGVKAEERQQPEEHAECGEYITGMTAFAELLGVSLATANVYKNSGKFDKAISQAGKGRRVRVNVKMALEIHNRLKGVEA